MTLAGVHGTSTLVDGGLLSNYPIDIFDRVGAAPRWPTFGVRLDALGIGTDSAVVRPVAGRLPRVTALALAEESVGGARGEQAEFVVKGGLAIPNPLSDR